MASLPSGREAIPADPSPRRERRSAPGRPRRNSLPRSGRKASPCRVMATTMISPGNADMAHRPPHELGRDFDLHQGHLALAEGQQRVQLGVRQQLIDALRTPGGYRDGDQPEPLVDLRPARIVQAADDPRHTVDRAGDARRHDVGRVRGAGGGEGLGRARCLPPSSTFWSKPTPVSRRPLKSGPSRASAAGSGSITVTSCPSAAMRRLTCEPTFPQPMMMTFIPASLRLV